MNDSPKLVSKEQIAGLLVLAADVALAYLSVYVLENPNTAHMLEVRIFKYGERFCQAQATHWAQLADVFDHAYNKSRLTVL